MLLKKGELCSLDIKNAFSQAGGFDRDVCLHAPAEWDPSYPERVWKFKAPAIGLYDSPAAFRRYLKRHLLNSDLSMKCVSLRGQAPTVDPCLIFVFREAGNSVGAPTAHIEDTLGCGEPDVLTTMRICLDRRFGELKLQESPFVRVDMELVHDCTFSTTLTQGDFFPRNRSPFPQHPNCGLLVGSCFPWRMSNCVNASLVNFVGLRLYLLQIFVLGWLALPLALIRCRAAMYIALMIWRRL